MSCDLLLLYFFLFLSPSLSVLSCLSPSSRSKRRFVETTVFCFLSCHSVYPAWWSNISLYISMQIWYNLLPRFAIFYMMVWTRSAIDFLFCPINTRGDLPSHIQLVTLIDRIIHCQQVMSSGDWNLVIYWDCWAHFLSLRKNLMGLNGQRSWRSG